MLLGKVGFLFPQAFEEVSLAALDQAVRPLQHSRSDYGFLESALLLASLVDEVY